MLLSNKKVLIFGGTGFLGKELVKKLVSDGFEDITIFSRDEGKLIELVQEYKNINILTGDIYDKFEVYQAMKEKDYIFHLAAFKHVGLAETQSRECIKTNLIGSLNILECSTLLTDPEATRFFWTVNEAVHLLFECIENSTNSNPYCPSMKSMSMGNLLEAMILKYGNGKRPNVKQIGLQQGENMHEMILKEGPSSADVDKFTVEEIMELI